MRRLITGTALALLTSGMAFSASAHEGWRNVPPPPPPRPAINTVLHVENTWTGGNGSTRNRNNSFRYVVDHLPPPPPASFRCHGDFRHGGPPQGHRPPRPGHGKHHGHPPKGNHH